MDVQVAARVQSHPSRREIRERLLVDLTMPTEVIETDFDPPNPWYGYIQCLTDPPDCTHLLIVQDDTVACRNLHAACEAIARVEPEVPVCLFMPTLPMFSKKPALQAGAAGERFVQLSTRDFMPVVAVLWPVGKTQEFLEWGTDRNRLRRRNGAIFVERSDDALGGRWMRGTQQRVLATIPSLIEHPDDVISTIARTNSGRTALFWHGQDFDALSVFS